MSAGVGATAPASGTGRYHIRRWVVEMRPQHCFERLVLVPLGQLHQLRDVPSLARGCGSLFVAFSWCLVFALGAKVLNDML